MRKFRARTFGDLLDEMAERDPAAFFGADSVGDETTYGEMAAQSDRVAGWLASCGIGPGSRVALAMPNRLDWLRLAFGAHKLDAAVVPISTFSTAREIEHELRDARPDLIVSVDRVRSNDLRAAFAAVDPAAPGMGLLHYWEQCRDDALASAPRRAAHPLRAASPAFILYTSGSTALPKGVVLEHANAIENAFNIGERMHLSAADRVYLAVPLFWSFGSINALPALLSHGGGFVCHESFEPASALDLIERHRCTVFYGMVNMARALAEHSAFAPERTASLRTGLSIGLPDDFHYMAEKLGIRDMCSVYGMTETYGNCCVTDAAMPAAERFRCSGPPLPGNELRAVDEEGRTAQPPMPGRIEVRGYTARYTNEALNAEHYTADGFFKTGDVGYLDGAGMMHFLARDNEMIKTGGMNVSPSEVEAVLVADPSVGQAYVVGLPDPTRGEVVFAFVVPAAQPFDAERLLRHSKRFLASYKVPVRLHVVSRDEIPTTSTGKVQRRKLRELAQQHAAVTRS